MDITEIRDIVIRKTDKHDIDDVDDAIRLVHKTYIQPSARITKTVDYVNGQGEIDLTDIADDIYKINLVDCNGTVIPLLNISEINEYGVRREGDRVFFQGLSPGKKLTFHYQIKLKDLGSDNPVPEIDEIWHDLYWLGAAAILNMEWYPMFQERLDKFRYEMINKDRPRGGRIVVKPWS